MAMNGPKILKAIKESGVTQVIFTGHSLGGGLAQVAHLYALENWKKDPPILKRMALRTLSLFGGSFFFSAAALLKAKGTFRPLKNVAFRTLTFSAPMTFFFSEDEFDELEEKNKDELARLKKTLSDDTR